MNTYKIAMTAFSFIAGALLASFAQASNLVVNGGFEQYSGAGSYWLTNNNEVGWQTSSGLTFVALPGTAGTGLNAPQNNFYLWTTSNGGVGNIPATSPAGGNFLASDANVDMGWIYQTVSGLTVGDSYDVSFYTGLAQQIGLYGPTYAYWQVYLGAQGQNTAVLHNVGTGFTGWAQDTLTFTATATSEVLAFMATGGPNGEPPYLLLDDVRMNDISTPPPAATPLPAALLFVAPALAGVFGFSRRKQNKA